MKKRMVTFLLLFQFSFYLLQAQTTAIPDSNFEQALIDLGIDSDSAINGKVLTSDIYTVTDLNVFNYDIVSLSGIEDFDSLTNLNCSNNQIKNIDLSNLSKLKDLNCASNLLSTLNISSNINLEKLNCPDNLLVTLNISSNTLLKNLDFTSNQITIINTAQNDSLLSLKGSNNQLISLSVGNNTLLEELAFSNNQIDSLNLLNNKFLRTLLAASNQLDSLNLSNNDSLNFVDVSNNQIRNFDVSNNLLLTNLNCSKNQLSTLNLITNDSLTFLAISNNQIESIGVSANKKLQHLIGASNQIMALDVSGNVNLTSLDVSMNLISNLDLSANDSLNSIDVSKNQLRSLSIKNGYNNKIGTFNATNNQELLCILVDDTSAIGQAWLKDNIASYNEVCNARTYIPDDHFEQALIDLGLDTGSLDNYVLTANIDTLKLLDIAGKGIRILTGLKDFIALTSLDCSNNLLYNLGVSSLEKLNSLNCSNNDSLTDLNLKNIQDSLVMLDATMNPLLICISVHDVAAANNSPNWMKDATASYNLACNTNKTFIPDDNFEQALIELGYDKGSLDDYVVTDSIKNIRILDVSKRNIFDLTGIEDFISLDSLNCSLNKLASLDVSHLDSLRKLSCFSNYLSALDITNNDSLLQLICGDNRITDLDVTKNTALLQLVCDANDLTKLDLRNNLNLLSLNCGSNYITNAGLFLDSNVYLIQLICPNNKLTAIDISGNVMLADLDCAGNYLSSLDLSKNILLARLNCSLNKLSNLDVANNNYLVDVECNSNQIGSLNFSENNFLLNLSADNNQLTTLNISSNDSLRRISVAANKLAAVNISKNLKLNYLKCDDNLLSTLDFSKNDSIHYLSLAGNKIPGLVTTNLKTLTHLNCNRNEINTLDLSSNKYLFELHCADNNIQNINLDSNKNVQVLDISNNKVSQILLGNQDSLKILSCAGNALKSLVLSENKVLQSLNCFNNQLEQLNVKNDNNDSLSIFNSTNNPDLSCIEVDDPGNSITNWQKDATASYSLNCHYNETYISDSSFEKALSAITVQPDNNDNYILTSSIDTLKSLDISNKNISDLSGIEDFAGLQILTVNNNNIDSLDLSHNNALIRLNVSGNLLDTLNLNNHTHLEMLDISNNSLTSIITDSLNSLRILNVGSNQLTGLNLSRNAALVNLSCSNNQLTTLSVNNGNNTGLVTFNTTNNPGLTCIEVDNPNAPVPSGWIKDNIASYSKDCHYNETYIPDDAFEQALIDAGYDYAGVDSLDDYIPNQKIINATDLNLGGEGIMDLTGLQEFKTLGSLNLKDNEISTIDISNNLKLKTLNISGNKLTKLDITKNSLLEVLDCSSNLLSTIDVSGNPLLSVLNLDDNVITTINLQNNIHLKTLDCSHTGVTNLDLNKNVNIEELTANYNDNLLSVYIQNGNNAQLKKLNLKFNPMLNCILVDNRDSAYNYSNWLKDSTAAFKIICDDDDNDGISNANDHCLSTAFGDVVDLFGCSLFILPPDNFKILVTGEICRSSNNGKINIAAFEKHNYKASIKVDGTNKEYHFTDSIEIRNLRSGTYELCVTVVDKPGYISCYEIVITEPVDISVLERVIPGDKKVSLKLSGGSNYTIDINGSIFKTSEDSITLNLENGINKIKIKTDAACQGIYEKNIFIGNDLVYYPNPYEDHFTVLLGKEYSNKVYVTIYSYSGKLVYSKWLSVQNGTVLIYNSTLSAGLYTVSLKSGKNQFTFKIVKK